MDISRWTEDDPPVAVRLGGSNRIHAATLVAGRLLFPACGVSVGTRTVRIPCTDPVDCPSCRHVAA